MCTLHVTEFYATKVLFILRGHVKEARSNHWRIANCLHSIISFLKIVCTNRFVEQCSFLH